jgi:hypothetical protein
MRWFEKNVEGCLQHWFGSLTVVYDGDPNALSSAAAPGTSAVTAAAADNGAKAGDSMVMGQSQEQRDEQQQQQRYIFGFQPHGLYPTGV